MEMHSYLVFDGTCEEAMRFYAQVLGGEITAMMPFRGTPAADHAPPEWQDKILHATLTVGDQVLMASDAPPGSYEKPQGFSVTLSMADPAEGERLFNALAEGGSVAMPYAATFWAAGFGMVTDRFGTPWMINCGEPASA